MTPPFEPIPDPDKRPPPPEPRVMVRMAEYEALKEVLAAVPDILCAADSMSSRYKAMEDRVQCSLDCYRMRLALEHLEKAKRGE